MSLPSSRTRVVPLAAAGERACAEGKTGLRVSRVAEEREQGNIPYLVNALFIRNLQVKPVDYRRFESMFSGENGDEA